MNNPMTPNTVSCLIGVEDCREVRKSRRVSSTAVALFFLALCGCQPESGQMSQAADPVVSGFSPARAIGNVQEICKIGNRSVGPLECKTNRSFSRRS